MISFFKKLFGGSEPPPNVPTTQTTRRPPIPAVRTQVPKTYAVQQNAEGREDFFDPSLAHYPRAFSRSDPSAGEAWRRARRQVIDHLLRLIAESPWQKHLILRGSLLLQEWMGDKAREPKDIDWVFTPSEIGIVDPTAQRLFEEITGYVTNAPCPNGPVINAKKIVWEDIWAYERASGKRILVPWRVEGLPPGEVQMDIVFSEPMPEDPIKTQVKLSDSTSLEFWAATKELSLAWKALWLANDRYPQGKDLYDATLLAESVTLRPELLYQVLRESDYYMDDLGPDMFNEFVDWYNFTIDYPWVPGDREHWQARFQKSMAGCTQMLVELDRRFRKR